MAEYIIKQALKAGEESICPKCLHYKVCRAYENQPCIGCNQFLSVADMRPVVRGKWIEIEEDLWGEKIKRPCCSRCFASKPASVYVSKNYCPNCGADMRTEPPKEVKQS